MGKCCYTPIMWIIVIGTGYVVLSAVALLAQRNEVVAVDVISEGMEITKR